MRLTADNLVGIGTTSPAQLLTVSSSSADAVVAIDCSYANGDGLLIIESANNRDSMIRFTEADTLKWQIYNDGTDDALKIQDDGDVRVTFDQSGDVTFTGDLIMADGKGIDFSADASPASGMTAEILDDYEEGTWTPTHGTFTFTTATGHYTKIGNLVTYSGFLQISNTATSDGKFDGLPFTSSASSNECTGSATWTGVDSAGDSLNPRIVASNTQFTFYSAGDDISWNDTLTTANTDQIAFSGFYYV